MMHKKRLLTIVLLFLVLGSLGVMAIDDTSTCGFWSKFNKSIPSMVNI